jgi:ketosteroid isomerase-like protein
MGSVLQVSQAVAGVRRRGACDTAGEDVAFVVAIIRCGSGTSSGPPEQGGFPFRLTIGLRNIDGNWLITHEHHSVPATD